MSRIVVVLFAVSLVARSTAAADAPLRLDAVLAEARERSPAILAARARADAAAAVPARVGALADPVVSWEAWNFPDGVRLDRADNNIFRLAQRLPFPGKRALAGTVAERDADVAGRDVDAVRLDVDAAVKAAYWDLWRAHQLLHVYTREKALVERFVRVAAERYATGTGGQADALRAQVELTRMTTRVATQALAIDGARAELNALLSRDADAPLGMPEDPPPARLAATPDGLTALALATRPELAGQAAAIARDEAGVRLARRDRLPDFEVAGARFVNHDADDGFGAFVSVTIPLAQKRRYDAAISEAAARLASTQAERQRLENGIRRDVAQAFSRARAALLRHELFTTTHVPQAEQALRVTEAGYRTGAVDFDSMTAVARTIEEVHLEHFEATADFEKAFAELERAVGTTLERASGPQEGSK